MNIAAIVLTFNEEKHIARCLTNLAKVTDQIFVIDSGSKDNTVQIAKLLGATVLTNPWINHASQLQWAIKNINTSAEWLIRLDADEYLNEDLINELNKKLKFIDKKITGIIVSRRIIFMGKEIIFGGIGSIKVLRIFRRGKGHVSDRCMDEHIYVSGSTRKLNGLILDDNLQSLTWWINKHNNYASLEAIEVLKLSIMGTRKDSSLNGPLNVVLKSFLKEKIYLLLPNGLRALLYFLYRYLFLFGFLDGYIGFVFHFNQAFWYRNLVDAKVLEINKHAELTGKSIEDSIFDVLGIVVKFGSVDKNA
jgi:glycosyltransferase involved in cell wall biosynthesis